MKLQVSTLQIRHQRKDKENGWEEDHSINFFPGYLNNKRWFFITLTVLLYNYL